MTDISSQRDELQKQLQTLNVLEFELRSLKPNAQVYNAISTPLETPLIAHSHGQTAMFPNLDAKTALEDVQKQKKVLLANLQQLEQ
ncbi:hypothetical protein PSEUBRA_005956 [Kalmanozyma brasiliensis GHG001]|uniref:uncharacterized protein n=1 Tax=Kalmanozyma brasiliensis (strain GHG001) TaxID=1365824 RepID=UPI001CE865F2|nr:uncharacterized protein PSEUBRA_005956 [Kalmanozyma brasiliensis GHG001]KAF6767586.1 hypothetical protein PSEUBRA_005956 [Kalmanozyma brasiliensis GHG001]